MPPILHSLIEAFALLIMVTAFVLAGYVAAEIMRDEPADIEAGEQR